MPEEKMSEEEYRTMFQLLYRHALTEMDQFDNFKFDTQFGKIFVSVSMKSQGYDDAFTDVSHLIKSEPRATFPSNKTNADQPPIA